MFCQPGRPSRFSKKIQNFLSSFSMDRDSPCLALTDSGVMATSAQPRKDPRESLPACLPACLRNKRDPSPRVNLFIFIFIFLSIFPARAGEPKSVPASVGWRRFCVGNP